MRGRGKTPRSAISAPIGPVKTSRGADLIRSETLIVVPTLKECENGVSTPVSATQTPRRVSAGFLGSGPRSGESTVASSDITATPTLRGSSKKLRKSFLANSSIPKPFKSAIFATSVADENVPPSSRDFDSPPHAPRSRLPKSRTMNALQELKSSMRPTLGIRSINTASLSSRKTSSSTVFSSTSSRHRLPRASAISLSRLSRSSTPEPQFGQVTSAQPSAYWSGRFVALHDRFSSENVRSISDASQAKNQGQTPYTSLYKRTAHLPLSTTMSALRTIPDGPVVPLITDDDARCRRIFAHLNSLCTTTDARRSLYSWQQAYARRQGRACLLPEGGSMEDRGIMAKIFGDKGDRRSLNALRQATANRGRRAVSGSSPTPSSRAKRLTVY